MRKAGTDLGVLNACLVLSQTFDRPNFLLVGQAAFHGVVRQDKDDGNANDHGDQPDDQEHDLPGREGVGGVVLEAEGQKTAEDGASPDTEIPQSNTRRLLVALVPLSTVSKRRPGQQLQRRTYHMVVIRMRLGATALSNTPAPAVSHIDMSSWQSRIRTLTKQHSCRHQTAKALARCCYRDDRTPQRHHDTQVLRSRKPLHGIPMRELHAQVADIEDQGERRELVARQVGVVAQPHHVGVVDQRLVQVLQAVTAPHQGHDHPVDLAEQALLVRRAHGPDGRGAALAQEGEGGVGVGDILDSADLGLG